MLTSSSQQSIPTTVKSGSSTLKKRRSVKLSDQQFGYFRLTRGLSRRTRHCPSMAGAWHGMCQLTRHGMAWGTAWARHGMCELALRRASTNITMAICGAHCMHGRHEKCVQMFELGTEREHYHSEYRSVGGAIILR